MGASCVALERLHPATHNVNSQIVKNSYMRKIVFILLMALCVPMCTVYAQDCSDRIQSAGKLYDNYKKTKNKKQLDEARKQLQNIINNPSNPENCRKSATSMLKKFRPVISASKANVDVAPIVVRVDTVVETHVNIDSVVNVVVHHDSLKVRRFYETEAAAQACALKKDYECAIDQYQTAVAYGRELQMGEGVISVFEAKIERNQQLQFNKMLDEAKQLESSADVDKALNAYEQAKRYGIENRILNNDAVASLDAKIEYLQAVQQMFEFVSQADEYYRAKEWALAKEDLEVAIDLSDTLSWRRGTIHWRHRLDTINNILSAVDRIHDYSTLEDVNKSAYQNLRPTLVTALHNTMLRLNYDIPTDTLTLSFLIHPDGRRDLEISMLREDTMLIRLLKEELQNTTITLPPGIYYGQKVPSKASYDFKIGLQGVVEVAKRKNNGKIIEDPLVIGPEGISRFLRLTEDTVRRVVFTRASPEFLYGKFTFKDVVSSVDNSTRSGFHLTKYNGTGGPANVFLSLVIPGLGRHRVTYGRQSGAGTAVFFYLFAGGSLGLRYWSIHDNPLNVNNNMDLQSYFSVGKYNKESFADMEKGQPKRIFYYTSYAMAGVAAIIYVSDVLYTLIRGSVNVAHQNKYKKWSVGVFYEPESKTPILQCNYKIK